MLEQVFAVLGLLCAHVVAEEQWDVRQAMGLAKI